MNWFSWLLDFLPRRSDVAALIHRLTQLETRIMATLEQFAAQLNRIDDATNAIADELRSLREDLKGQGLSSELETELLDRLSSAADRLTAIAAPPDPAA
jgi:uncharacterized protein (UPF0335 family)